MNNRKEQQAGKWTPVIILSVGIVAVIAYVSLSDRRLKNVLKQN